MRRALFSLLLVSLLLCLTPGLHAQTFNLQTGREPVASLDGLWRFHTGDNPGWADPGFDDSQWPLLRSDEEWGQQGYKNYGGFAWYRFTVAVPDGSRNWSIYLGPMETGYQLFVDGRLAGSFGPIQSSRNYAISSRVFDLSPAAASGPRTFHIAIRAWHAPNWAGFARGGFYGGNYFGDSRFIAQRAATDRSLQWNGFGNEYTYAVLSTLVGLVVLVLFFIRRQEREYLWFALLLLANAIDIGLGIGRLLALIPLPVFDLVDGLVQAAALFAALAFFSVVLHASRSRSWWLIVALLFISPPTVVFLYVFNITPVAIAGLLGTLALLPAIVWILVTLVKRSLQRDRDALILLAPTLLWQGFPLIDNILLVTWQLGWQRWTAHWVFPLLTKPFVLMPGPAVGTIYIFALLLFLIRRFSLARQEETRLASELESAHSIQRTLVPPISASCSGYDLNGLSLPSEEVGGDLVDVVVLPNQSILAYVADVSGHGLPASILMGMIKTAVRTILLESWDDSAFLLAGLCDRLNRALPAVKAPHMYATLSAIYLAPDGRVRYTLAGHPSILHYRASSRTVQEITCHQLPVGLLPVDAYISHSLQMEEGDLLAIATDGILEAANTQQEEFGSDRIAALLTEMPGQNLAGIRDSIVSAAKAFGKQADDQTILLIRRVE
ncbi:SpoIIE family protein phosphatase [Terriglobus albidus]|uniref:SpoIIE family protein phosphatase n=1 Tax=Terriglobus albidus TaxID=1592106 RepID=A0A5B9EFD4_9BACT|nr:SpoIIE family protein phosphatase [Terriglobus albidus]QEE30499.1 SpoIIE family protein phosphatase [Terriglobus albidus]